MVTEQKITGIELRSGAGSESIRIKFMYKGMQCREPLKLSHTKQNINYAVRLRAEILNAIERDVFDYGKFFPESKTALKFGHVKESNLKIGDMLRAYLVDAKKTLAPSTFKIYSEACNYYLFKEFENTLITELKAPQLRTWLKTLDCKAKSINNITQPLRNVIEGAINDDLIEYNPFERIVLKKIISKDQFDSEFEVDPFTIQEIGMILAACKNDQVRNLWKFAFATGMRPSELMALEWPMIDWVGFTVPVRRVRVVGETTRRTKTAAGKRDIDMRRAAYEALKSQEQYTKMRRGLIFHNENMDDGFWSTKMLRKHWNAILFKAKVRYRNPYQTRHTFASTLLSAGGKPLYVANQMGHKTVEMINRNYGRWINQGNDAENQKLIIEFYGKVSEQDFVSLQSNNTAIL